MEREGERKRGAKAFRDFFKRSHSVHERNINFESDRCIRLAVPSLRDRSETGSLLSSRPSSPLAPAAIPRGGHRRTIRYDRHYLDARVEKERRRNRR